MARDIVLVDPLPRRLGLILTPEFRRRLDALGEVIVSEDRPMPDETVDRLLPQTTILIGQTALPRERLDRAPRLKAVFNVETNFLPNIDYAACQARGIAVLAPTRAFAGPVAEAALAMAIDLARGITAADRAFRAGTEQYGLAGNADSFRFAGAPVGIIGFGDLGHALRALLVPFRNPVRVYDPWLPARAIEEQDCRPATLEDVLAESRVIFVLASVTTENAGFLSAAKLALIQPGAALLLMSRAAVADFPALLDAVRQGRFRAAVDVFPEEPVALDDPMRRIDGLLLSAHRTGGIREAFLDIGRMVVEDAELILHGLPPVLCRRADPATAARLRSKAVVAS